MPICKKQNDASGSIASGGTAQMAVDVNDSRIYLLLQNISDTTIWVDFDTPAVADEPSIELIAGASLVYESSFVPRGYVSIMCASTSKKYVLKEA